MGPGCDGLSILWYQRLVKFGALRVQSKAQPTLLGRPWGMLGPMECLSSGGGSTCDDDEARGKESTSWSSLPLADLHRHLDGSLRPETVVELASARGLDVPSDLPFVAGMGLEAALARFEFTLSLLQEPESVRRVASEICEDAVDDHVTTLEIRFAPQLHRGAVPEEIVDAALDGIGSRAGLLLCGLYGEPPTVLEHLVSIAQSRPGVVGVDLAGGPAPGHSFGLSDYGPAFRRAETLGLGRTVHAAEGRGPGEIAVAIEELRAQRIGHGTTLLNDPAVLDLVLERGTVLEACPTSNYQVGVIETVASHPIARWVQLGVAVCVNTDNTLLSRVTVSEELSRVASIPQMTTSAVRSVIQTGHSAAFRRR
ncbi:MAG TPA: adenosine deaminase [Deltaproteobacteria bacterium]|nr:adenosine deaminase [Deltaproteobacteria bacterium]